jgi:energy-coupling factor transporter ATP-binding protein EcfA2
MHIAQFRLTNYSAFEDTGWIRLSAKLNVVVGLNNSGKSALLAALGSSLPQIQHRNEHQYLPGDIKNAYAEIDLSTSTGEIRRRLSETGMAVQTTSDGGSNQARDDLKAVLQDEINVLLKIQCIGGQSNTYRDLTFKGRLTTENNPTVKQIRMAGGELVIENSGSGVNDTIFQLFTTGEDPAFFYFSAQRFNVASTGFSTERRLRSDAQNLPSVLAFLSGNNPSQYREIEDRVREILPGVGSITVSTEEGNFKILVWPSSGPTTRELAVDLSNSGTGVSQIIAIITAVVKSGPSVIAIDEINSYLHPAATKQMLQILTTFYPQHQYIVSTHSSDVMTFPNIDQLLMVEKSDFASSIRTIDRSNLAEVRSAFRHLGISMTDVLGADRIVWVEGATEELVFPDLLRRAGVDVDSSVRFAGVASTGDFSKRGSSRKAVIDLYTKATAAVAPLVQGSSFLLDRETLSDDAVEQIARQTDNRLTLLRRRCLECYVLNLEAIATLLNAEVDGLSVSAKDVENKIAELAGDVKYGAASKWRRNITDEEWLKRVDAPKLLSDVFAALTDNRLSFDKTSHTPRLMAETPIEDLNGVVQTLVAALNASQPD